MYSTVFHSTIAITEEMEDKDRTIANQQAFIDSIQELAESLGYKEGMKDENGNVITIQVFLERKANEDAESLKNYL